MGIHRTHLGRGVTKGKPIEVLRLPLDFTEWTCLDVAQNDDVDDRVPIISMEETTHTIYQRTVLVK